MIKLSKRLEKIASLIPDNESILDIGCDHALLDIYLAKERKNIQITASDINQKSLATALSNIKKYKVSSLIKVVQSDGLNAIDTTHINTIIISGMGSHTMVGILYQNLPKLKNVNRLILQSNNDLDFLRYKITKIGYYIKDEILIKEKNLFYTIIVFQKGYRFYTKKNLYLGPCLAKENSKLFQEKCLLEYKKMLKFYSLIPKHNLHHRLKIKWRIKTLKKVLN